MARQSIGTYRQPILAFNRGIVSNRALARIDLEKPKFAAETQTNWMPRTLGSMMLRPGMQYLGTTKGNNASVFIPFVFSTTDFVALELTGGYLRVWKDDALLTIADVDTEVVNPSFASAMGTGWVDASDTVATAAISGGNLYLTGTGYGGAKVTQTLTVAAGDQNVRHTLAIRVFEGTAVLKVGSTSGAADYISETSLGVGKHYLSFTPTGASAYIEISNYDLERAALSSFTVAAAGVFAVDPGGIGWAEEDLSSVRYDQSADVVYLTFGSEPVKIERRGDYSWSVVSYRPNDGPFRAENLTTNRITASAVTGLVTLTADRALFETGHEGALFKIRSKGQATSDVLFALDQVTDYIRVVGTGSNSRTFNFSISGTFTASVKLQRAIGEPVDWTDVDAGGYTSPTSSTRNDSGDFDKVDVYYRWRVDAYTSGAITITMDIDAGYKDGIVRINKVSSKTSATANVIAKLGNTNASEEWWEGAWSDYRGWPTALSFYEGRLCLAGKGSIWMSVSDAYESFDSEMEGAAKAISRTIGSGPLDSIRWMLNLNRLVLGTDGAEWSARSSSFDEILTADNFNLKDPSTLGSAAVAAVKVDSSGVFVQRSKRRVYSLRFAADNGYDYAATDWTAYADDVCADDVTRLAVQRQPDTRIHAVLADGTVRVLISLPEENVTCWIKVETDGDIEEVFVLPGAEEDRVYYVVKRVIDGSTVRYLEKWALESECVGDDLTKLADSFLVYDSTATDTITGLGHLEGEEVVVWGDGADLGTATVSSGAITLSAEVSKAVVGLSYTAEFKSARVVGQDWGGIIPENKRISSIAFVLADTHYQGLKYGPSLEYDESEGYLYLDDLPLVGEDGAEVAADTVFDTLTTTPFSFSGEYTTDSRACLVAQSPRPCTVLAAILGMTSDGQVP